MTAMVFGFDEMGRREEEFLRSTIADAAAERRTARRAGVSIDDSGALKGMPEAIALLTILRTYKAL